MSVEAAATLFETGAGLLFLAWQKHLWDQHFVEVTRQRLFEVRDRLFDEAASAGKFDSPAYQATRLLINGQIRYAHKNTFGRLLIGNFLRQALSVRSASTALPVAMRILLDSEADSDFNKKLHRAQADAQRISSQSVVQRAMWLWPFVAFAALGLGLREGVNALAKSIADADAIEAQALNEVRMSELPQIPVTA
jgi:hypothetical protein